MTHVLYKVFVLGRNRDTNLPVFLIPFHLLAIAHFNAFILKSLENLFHILVWIHCLEGEILKIMILKPISPRLTKSKASLK